MHHYDGMKLDLPLLRKLAVDGSVDPRTIARVARGERVRGLAYYRAMAALLAAGIVVPEPRDDEVTAATARTGGGSRP